MNMKAKQNQISFDLTADNLLEGIQIISPEWRYVYINKAAAIQGRSTPQELTDKTMLEVYPGIESTGDVFHFAGLHGKPPAAPHGE